MKKFGYWFSITALFAIAIIGTVEIYHFYRRKSEGAYQMIVYAMILLFAKFSLIVWKFQRAYYQWHTMEEEESEEKRTARKKADHCYEMV